MTYLPPLYCSTRIEKLAEPTFDLFRTSLRKYKGSTVREMSSGVEEFLNAALQNNLTSTMKLVLEAQDPTEILDEPDNSLQLRCLMRLDTSHLR